MCPRRPSHELPRGAADGERHGGCDRRAHRPCVGRDAAIVAGDRGQDRLRQVTGMAQHLHVEHQVHPQHAEQRAGCGHQQECRHGAARRSAPAAASPEGTIPRPLVVWPRRRYTRPDVTAQGTGRTGELLSMSPLHAIIQLGAPTMLVMGVAAASNVALTYYVSRLGTDAIGAVSLVFPVSLLATTAMAGGLGAGASSAVARALGGGRPEKRAPSRATPSSWRSRPASSSRSPPGSASRPFFGLMGAHGAVLDGASRFAHVLFGGAAITFTAGMLDSVLRGEGNVRVPAIWSSASLLGQIAITPVLMFGMGLGLVGAPIAMLDLSGDRVAAAPALGVRGRVQRSGRRWTCTGGQRRRSPSCVWEYPRQSPPRSPTWASWCSLVSSPASGRTRSPPTASPPGSTSCCCPSPTASAPPSSRWWQWRPAPAVSIACTRWWCGAVR